MIVSIFYGLIALIVLSIYTCVILVQAEGFMADTIEERVRKVPVPWNSRLLYLLVFPGTLLLGLAVGERGELAELFKELWQVVFKGHRPIVGPMKRNG